MGLAVTSRIQESAADPHTFFMMIALREKLSYASFLFTPRAMEAEETQLSVIILSAPRTGSTLLSTYLDSIASFKSHGEVINPETYPFFKKIGGLPFRREMGLFKMRSKLADEQASIKLIFSQLERLNIRLADLQQRFPNAKFMVIYRRHLINSYISYLRAKSTQEWSSKLRTQSQSSQPSFYIDQDEFLAYCHRIKNHYLSCRANNFLSRSMVVNYEALAGHPQQLFDEMIFPFLKLSPVSVKSPLKKQITRPLSDLIDNFESVRAVIESPAALLDYDCATQQFH